MPTILAHETHKFTPKTKLIGIETENYLVSMDKKEGDGLFSAVGNLAKTGINFVSRNKDIISNVAKGTAAVGSAAAHIASAVDSKRKLDQLQKIEELRHQAEERKRMSLSDKNKKELANKLGSGFVRVN